jgi:hypothetical protein
MFWLSGTGAPKAVVNLLMTISLMRAGMPSVSHALSLWNTTGGGPAAGSGTPAFPVKFECTMAEGRRGVISNCSIVSIAAAAVFLPIRKSPLRFRIRTVASAQQAFGVL